MMAGWVLEAKEDQSFQNRKNIFCCVYGIATGIEKMLMKIVEMLLKEIVEQLVFSDIFAANLAKSGIRGTDDSCNVSSCQGEWSMQHIH
jgi:hypothetical protein